MTREEMIDAAVRRGDISILWYARRYGVDEIAKMDVEEEWQTNLRCIRDAFRIIAASNNRQHRRPIGRKRLSSGVIPCEAAP